MNFEWFFNPLIQPALLAGVVAFGVALLLVVTQDWHGHLSIDSEFGVQKFHTRPTPRIGGVAIAAAAIAGYLASSTPVRDILGPMLVAGIPAFGAGILEDLTKRVGVLPRLLATMVSGLLACYLTGVAMQNTGVPAIDWALGYLPLAIVFTAFAVGGVANAVNIIDGFNGLATGSVAIMLCGMGLIAWHVGDMPLATLSFTLAGVLLGFAAINWPMGYIFLGDGGAYFVGFLLAWIAVLLPMRNPEVTAWATLLVCGYPVIEVVFSFIRKSKRKGHSPGQPDRVHLHMLMYRRLSKKAYPNASSTLQNGLTSPFAWCYTLIPVSLALLFHSDPWALAFGFLASAGVYWVVYQRLSQFKWCFQPHTMDTTSTSNLDQGA